MAAVSLLRGQCLRSFQLGRGTSLYMSRSISSKPRAGTFFPSQSSSSSFIHRILPRTTSLSTLLPSTSVLSDSSLSRTFSTPTKKPEIHENLYTIPNILTFTRLLSTPVIAYLILNDKPYLATALLFYAGLTDLVDGWIARKYNLKSVVGTIIDPMADKFLMITLTGALAYTGAMPVWLAVIILGRDVGLGISALYYRYISLPPPKTFARYWDFSLPSAEVHPTTISKFNTLLQLVYIGLCTIEPILVPDISTYMTALQYTVATTTIWSGLSYVYSKDAVKILKSGDN